MNMMLEMHSKYELALKGSSVSDAAHPKKLKNTRRLITEQDKRDNSQKISKLNDFYIKNK